MSSSAHGEGCLQLAEELDQLWSSKEDLNQKHKQLIASLRSVNQHDDLDGKATLTEVLPALANHVQEVVSEGQPEEFTTAFLNTLAGVTREVPLWRPLFGLDAKPDRNTNLAQMRRGNAPDTILEVARRIIAGTIHVSSSEQLRAALRIIANCCADNNINRSIIINRDGIESLLELLEEYRECELVVPVLYNVCVDHDELAADVNGKPWNLPQLQSTTCDASSAPTLSIAEQRLGTYWCQYRDQTSFAVLLGRQHQVRSSTGTLADLIEMGSRAALYGLENFVQEKDGSEPGDIIEVDTTADIIQVLLTEGFHLARLDHECRLSICQAILNILSHPETHTTVIQTMDGLRNLVSFPYNPMMNNVLDDEEEEALAPYKPEFLKLIYKISSTDQYAAIFPSQWNLIYGCIESMGTFLDDPKYSTFPATSFPFAGICVLAANSVTTTDRAGILLQYTKISRILHSLLLRYSDADVLLPALDLAARLALCPPGQDAFCTEKVNMFPAIAKVLRENSASNVNMTGLENQRNAIVLARLLVKGRSERIQRFNVESPSTDKPDETSPSTNLAQEISMLWDRTDDKQTKIEIARLMIETLRTMYSPTTASKSQDNESVTDTSVESQTTPTSIESVFLDTFARIKTTKTTVADMIVFILTHSTPQDPSQSQTQSEIQSQIQAQSASTPSQTAEAEAEAWFGLALLSTISSARPSITASLERNNFQLLDRLCEIVSTNANSLISSSSSRTHPTTHDDETPQVEVPTTQTASKDPRYENIKVFVVKMLQVEDNSSSTEGQRRSDTERQKGNLVQTRLEAAAADMGLDWVVL